MSLCSFCLESEALLLLQFVALFSWRVLEGVIGLIGNLVVGREFSHSVCSAPGSLGLWGVLLWFLIPVTCSEPWLWRRTACHPGGFGKGNASRESV